jgi:hypothetical protein
MTPEAAIQAICEGKSAEGWSGSLGVYADHSNWPHEVKWYVRCPKCGGVHGTFTSMREAHAKKLCPGCDYDSVNALKDEVQKVLHDPQAKIKPMAKLVGEAEELPLPPEPDPVPEPDFEAEPNLDAREEVIRMLAGNWVDVALIEFAANENIDTSEIEIESRHFGDYDADDKDSTTRFEFEVAGQTYKMFKDEDVAEEFALELVTNDLEHEPDVFNQEWLSGFIDEDSLRNAIGDPYEDWDDEVNSLDYDELLTFLYDNNYVDSNDPFYDADGEPLPETPELAALLDSKKQDYIDNEKPTVDPWAWMRDVYGRDAMREALRIAQIDIKAAAESAVRTDGWAHFVAHYDHDYTVCDNGAVYCRIN